MPVFACSMGDNAIHYSGHVRMMAAVQPFISGAISKTVNMPEEVTVEDVEQLHIDAWQLGVKAVAIYRDNCKVAQPLATAKKEADRPTTRGRRPRGGRQVVERIVEQVVVTGAGPPEAAPQPPVAHLRVPGGRLQGLRDRRRVRGRPARRALHPVSKQGSTLAGIMDAFAISISYGLQYGVPLRAFVETFTSMRFEPAGMTDDPDIRIATSLMDYLFRRLAVDYLSPRGAGRARHPHHRRAHPADAARRRGDRHRDPQGHDIVADPPSIESATTLALDLDLTQAKSIP